MGLVEITRGWRNGPPVLASLVWLTFATLPAEVVRADDLRLLCGAATAWPLSSCDAAAGRFERISGHTVEIVEAPADSAETLNLLMQLFAVESDAIDVIQMDIVWPGILARHLADLGPTGRERIHAQSRAAAEAATLGERAIGLPLYIDTGALFYRRDLLERYDQVPPATWNDLRQAAGRILGLEAEAGRRLDGYLFQGRAYEGLTCNALEWVVSFGGPPLVDQGAPKVNEPAFETILGAAATWVGETSPLSNLDAGEAETFDRYASGHAVFMRHWASSVGRLKTEVPEVFEVTGVSALPAGEPGLRRAGVLGGWLLGVSAYSGAPEAARALALFLASDDEQRRRALDHGLFPAASALQNDLGLQKSVPGLQLVADLIDEAVIRPSKVMGPGYPFFSHEVATAIHAVLAGEATAAEGLGALQRRLDRLSGGGQRWSF